MPRPAPTFFSKELNRRQFGMAASGGVVLLIAGGTYGVVAHSGSATRTSVRTTFGEVSIIRGSRFARLDAQGHTATNNLLTTHAHFAGGGTPDSRRAVAASAGAITSGLHQGHDGPTQDHSWPQPVNLTWGDVLVLEAEVHNAGRTPVLFSPAQLRLKLAQAGTTITHQDTDRPPGPLGAAARERILISYLAPHSLADLELEFSDLVLDIPLRLALPPLTMSGAFS
ncbi:MAG: hypothetical protein JWM61_2235 [Micrococcaceae bacterium]|jgi:hypothetical protein|nr:hypothetical protein [Micrococcaceae bacterium]